MFGDQDGLIGFRFHILTNDLIFDINLQLLLQLQVVTAKLVLLKYTLYIVQ